MLAGVRDRPHLELEILQSSQRTKTCVPVQASTSVLPREGNRGGEGTMTCPGVHTHTHTHTHTHVHTQRLVSPKGHLARVKHHIFKTHTSCVHLLSREEGQQQLDHPAVHQEMSPDVAAVGCGFCGWGCPPRGAALGKMFMSSDRLALHSAHRKIALSRMKIYSTLVITS